MMKIFALLLLVGCALGTPVEKDDILVVTEEFFPEELVIYKSHNNIVKLLVPVNELNFADDEDDKRNDSLESVLFFIEGKEVDGKIESKGAYVLKNKVAKKLLDDAVDFTAPAGDSKLTYFATPEGIYVYNPTKNTAEKYGSVTDSIISIAAASESDTIYILTEDKKLYKVTDSGNKKVMIGDVTNANEIMLDYSDNLYYWGEDKTPYVVSADGTKRIEGLPSNPKKVLFARPMFVHENGVNFISDSKPYTIFANGTSEYSGLQLNVKPTAYAPEGTVLQYYAYKNKIYEYNLLALVLESMLDEVKDFMSDKKDELTELANKSRNEIIAVKN